MSPNTMGNVRNTKTTEVRCFGQRCSSKGNKFEWLFRQTRPSEITFWNVSIPEYTNADVTTTNVGMVGSASSASYQSSLLYLSWTRSLPWDTLAEYISRPEVAVEVGLCPIPSPNRQICRQMVCRCGLKLTSSTQFVINFKLLPWTFSEASFSLSILPSECAVLQ